MLDIWQCTSTRSIVGCRNVEVFSVSRNQRQYISWCGYCCGRVTVTLIGSHPAPDLLMVKYKRSWVLSPPLFTKCQLDKYFSSISFTQFIFSVEICTQIGPLWLLQAMEGCRQIRCCTYCERQKYKIQLSVMASHCTPMYIRSNNK